MWCRASLITICAVLAGCLNPSASTVEPRDTLTDPKLPGFTWLLTSCTYDEALQTFPWGTGPGEAPEQWPSWQYEPYTGLFYVIQSCEQIDWGPFSRGPITLVYEFHNEFEAPESCAEGRPGVGFLLTSIGFDDEEIATYAREEIGLPAYHSEVTLEDERVNGVGTKTWSWGPDNSRSSLTFYVADVPVPMEQDTGVRLFFIRDDLPAALDMRSSIEADSLPYRFVQGTIREPMLVGSDGVGQFVGTSSHTRNGTREASIIYYEDWECTPKESGNATI